MKLALDTNRYRDFCVGDPVVVDRIQLAEKVFLPFVTLAELHAGFQSGTQAHKNERILLSFLNRPRVSVLYAGEATTRHYAQLFYQLRQQGTPIPTNESGLPRSWLNTACSFFPETNTLSTCRICHASIDWPPVGSA